MRRKSLGNIGEALAKDHLEKAGYQILHQNWRYGRYGEVDIIAYSEEEQRLTFIEVKMRSNQSYGSPIEAIREEKQRKMRFLAEAYIALFNLGRPFKDVSFDVVTVVPSGRNDPRWIVEHHRSAF